MAKRCKRQRGVTLIEQVMVVAMIGVLAAIAIPPMTQLLQRNQVRLAQTELLAALHHARGLAVTSGKSTLFCPSQDGARCDAQTRWESGWLIGHDPARKGQPETPAVHTHGAHAGVVILGDSGRKLVRFRSDGTSIGTTNTWRICQRSRPDQALVVVISNTGRARGATATPEQAASCAAAQ